MNYGIPPRPPRWRRLAGCGRRGAYPTRGPRPFLVLAFHAPVWLVAAAMLVNGVCVDIFEVLWATSLQTHIPNDALARISSYDMLGSFVLGPLGLLAVGPIAAIGVTPTLIGACAILTTAPLLTSAVRDLAAEAQPAAPSPLL